MNCDIARAKLAAAMHQLVAGDANATSHAPIDAGDPSPIPLDSPVRIVHGDPAMFVGGVRALLFQTLHPVTMQAVAEHGSHQTDPLGRLRRTAQFLGATTFGSGTDAHNAIERVRTIHQHVTGTMDDGTPYRADDPHLLGWVHATEVDSFLCGHQRYGSRALSPTECDRYIADMATVGEALGVTRAPRSRSELVATLEGYRAELHPTEACRDTTRFLVAPALPLSVLPFYSLVFASSVALLPRWARSMLLLPLVPGVDPLVLRPAMTALARTLRWAKGQTPRTT